MIDAIHDLEEMEGLAPSVGEMKLPQVSSPAAVFLLFVVFFPFDRTHAQSFFFLFFFSTPMVTEVACCTL